MRIALSLAALLLSTAATPAPRVVVPDLDYVQVRPAENSVCRDRIELVRAERGLPRLQRESASEQEALLIAAVDHRIDGCSVMVMRNNTADVRPLPAPREGPITLERIPAQ